MLRRFAMTVGALGCSLVLSASAVAATPTAMSDRAITKVDSCGSKAVASGRSARDSAKPEPVKGQGKKLGHGKQKQKDPPGSDSEVVETEHERKQNHGWFVSQAAHDDSLSGREHGKAVSEVARSDQGKPSRSEP